LNDCNNNTIPDECDILNGTSIDILLDIRFLICGYVVALFGYYFTEWLCRPRWNSYIDLQS
jgi:hypothetical protein